MLGQLGLSGGQATAWASDTFVLCKLQGGVGASLVSIFSSGFSTASFSSSFSYELSAISSLSNKQLETSGGVGNSVIGAHYGVNFFSNTGRGGGSSSTSTTWKSDTSIVCIFSAGISGSLLFTLTTSSRVGSVTEAVTFHVESISSLLPTNLVASGQDSVTASGSEFGISLYSLSGRIGFTTFAQSNWISDTSTLCLSAAGVGGAFHISVTVGSSYGTLLAAVSYNVPTIVSGSSSSQSRSLSGNWCAFNSNPCSCQGIVGGFLSGAFISGSAVDSLPSVTCTYSTCYCFNLPFTGGQVMTVTGQEFGTADYTSAAIVGSTSAEFTRWVSQSSILCALPTCTDCLYSSPSESIVIIIDGQSSFSSSIPVNYNLTARRAGSFGISRHQIIVPYSFFVEDSQRCPHFWLKEGRITISQNSGLLCRLQYGLNDNIWWIIDPCSGSLDCSHAQVEADTRALIQTRLSFSFFSSGVGDVLILSSCNLASCSPSRKITSLRGMAVPPMVVGEPYIHLNWKSDEIEDTTAGWLATWEADYNRKFKIFSTQLAYKDAVAFCKTVEDDNGGWHLASVCSVREQGVVEELASSLSVLAPVWIGLALNEANEYEWADRSRYEPEYFSNWIPGGQTLIQTTGQGKITCAVIHHRNSGWAWESEDCLEKLAFICSKR